MNVRVSLLPQRPPGGQIDFDVHLGGTRVEGRILPGDPEWAVADMAITKHVTGWTFAGATAPTIEVPVERVNELAARRWN